MRTTTSGLLTALLILATSVPSLGSPHGGGHPTGPPYTPGDVVPPRQPNPGTPGTPATPGTPGTPGTPTTPSTPGSPTTPGTGRATPGSRRPGGPTTGGIVINFERGETSKDLMKWRWDYPPALEQRKSEGPTIAVPRMYALTREEALARLTKEDARPLLIFRDCGCWKDYYHTVLGRCLLDEKTSLYGRYFHCVRLPGHVLKKNHTYYNLFDEKDPAHMVLSSGDGTRRIKIHGKESVSDVWKLMEVILDQDYRKPSGKAVKDLMRLMSKYDYLDSRKMQIREQMEAEIEKNGPGSSKMERLKKDLDKTEKEFADLKKKEKDLLDLGLRAAPVEKK